MKINKEIKSNKTSLLPSIVA
uniref:Uncharacterized protein n=1 Tax=Anguilla anguilla TaxID=7936 RepID=A0A0E9TZ00_ANGAN